MCLFILVILIKLLACIAVCLVCYEIMKGINDVCDYVCLLRLYSYKSYVICQFQNVLQPHVYIVVKL